MPKAESNNIKTAKALKKHSDNLIVQDLILGIRRSVIAKTRNVSWDTINRVYKRNEAKIIEEQQELQEQRFDTFLASQTKEIQDMIEIRDTSAELVKLALKKLNVAIENIDPKNPETLQAVNQLTRIYDVVRRNALANYKLASEKAGT